MLKEEEYEIIEKQLNKTMNLINTYINNFLRKYESFKKYNYYICKIITENDIFKNRKKIEVFSKIIMDSETMLQEANLEIQEKSEMRKKRKDEISLINKLIETDYKFLLDTNNYNKLACPNNHLLIADKKEEDDILVKDTQNKKNEELLKKKRFKGTEKGKDNKANTNYD